MDADQFVSGDASTASTARPDPIDLVTAPGTIVLKDGRTVVVRRAGRSVLGRILRQLSADGVPVREEMDAAVLSGYVEYLVRWAIVSGDGVADLNAGDSTRGVHRAGGVTSARSRVSVLGVIQTENVYDALAEEDVARIAAVASPVALTVGQRGN